MTARQASGEMVVLALRGGDSEGVKEEGEAEACSEAGEEAPEGGVGEH